MKCQASLSGTAYVPLDPRVPDRAPDIIKPRGDSTPQTNYMID